MVKFNARQLITDCGGVAQVAQDLGKSRTAPYRMMATGYMGTPILAKLLEHHPDINLNKYFERQDGQAANTNNPTDE